MKSSELDPPSPCINVCVLDERSEYCLGCYRTLDEIAAWTDYTPDEKRTVIAELERRPSAALQQQPQSEMPL